ncbi:FecR domain-containing protein [Candidatus Peregrinibacteria bacterium]|nr:FecR domain-containing protein [Candidatus Peregrinibacteria bacterium]
MYSGEQAAGAVYENQPLVSAYGESVVEIKKADSEEWIPAAPKQPLMDGDSVKTEDASEAVIDFQNTKTIIQMASNTEIAVSGSSIKLINGEVWVNTSAALAEFNLETVSQKISAIDAIFDVFAQDKNAVVRNISGGIRIIGNKDLFVNAGNQVDFAPDASESKIDSDWMQSNWYSANISKDDQEKNLMAKDLRDEIQKSGTYYSSVDSTNFSIKKFLMNFKAAITFSDKKLRELYLSFISDLIDDGTYYFSVDDKQNGQNTFMFVLNYARDVDKENLNGLKDLFVDKFKKLKVFGRSHGNIYTAREKMRDLIFGSPVYGALTPEQKIYFIRTYLYDAVAEYDYIEANNLLASYFRNLLRAARTDKKNFAKYIAEDNGIASEIIINNPIFYKKENFAFKSDLEKLLEDQDKKSFIADKIIFLKYLKEYALNEEISVSDSLAISDFLNSKIKDCIAAVNDADKKSFESDLERLSDFFAFLADKSYANSTAYGVTVSDRFLAYLNYKRQEYQIEELKKSLAEKEQTVGPENKLDIEDIKKAISAKFEENGIKIEEFGEPQDDNATYISINKAVKDDVVFSATYNREAEVVSDIKTEDGYEFSLGVKLPKVSAALSTILSGEEHAAAPFALEEEQIAEESPAEISAKNLVIEKLDKFDVKVFPAQVFIVNLMTKEFKIQGAEIENKKEKILINFDFKDPFTEVANVELKTQNGITAYGADKTISLQDLNPKMIEFAEKIYYEQLDKEIESSKFKAQSSKP